MSTQPDESVPKSGPLQGFVAGVFIKIITDPQVEQVIKSLLGDLITERILPVIPIAVGAAAKAAVDELVTKIPEVEGVVDIVKTTDAAWNTLNNLIPGLNLGNLLDFWRPKP